MIAVGAAIIVIVINHNFIIMTKNFKSFYVGLCANIMHSGLNEILSFYATRHSEEEVGVLVGDVARANQQLYETMNVVKIKRSIYAETREMVNRIVAMQRYLDSCRYLDDALLRGSADYLLALFASYGKAFAMMKANSRMGAVSTLLRDLGKAELAEHIGRLPEMASRIEGLRAAYEQLRTKQIEVDRANSQEVEPCSLLDLKRNASGKLRSLTDYLRVMSELSPEQYGEEYHMVSEIIDRINSSMPKRKKPAAAALTLQASA